LPDAAGFKLVIREANQLIYDSDPVNSATGLNRTVEDCVNSAIEQYQWEYKRFKRRPDGTRFYR
jgi:KDO2-lipid IV(A) lauroyltransferase